MEDSKTMAALDMGTNTFLLLIGQLVNGEMKILYQERQFVRLGKGGISEGKIAADASERALDTMNRYCKIMSFYHVDHHVAIATSALRNASNGQELLDRIQQETGISPIIIDGDLEAQLIYEGVGRSLGLDEGHALVMDIGGGSVEFIIGEGGATYWKKSFEIGAQRLCDRFFTADPIGKKNVEALKAFLEKELKPLKEAIDQYAIQHFIGSSGSFDTVWELYSQALIAAEQPAPNTHELEKADFTKLHQRLISSKQAVRLKMPGMLAPRVDMIVVASCLVDYVFSILPIKRLLIAQAALKEGALHRILSGKAIQ